MRIAVCGKGGAGKTTISATLARCYARDGYRVVALDDDPNPNLAVSLGLTEEQRSRMTHVRRADVLETVTDAEGNKSLRLTKPFEEVVAEYGMLGPDGVTVLNMTGVLGAGQG